ncbi:hypothetical protein ABKV19_013961 [Rosa sericea]
MIQALIPLMKHSSAGGRIVSMSSRLGRLNGKQNEEHIEIAKAKRKAGETEFCSTEEQLHATIKSLQYIIQQECILFRKTLDRSNNLKTHVDTLLLLLLYKPRFKNQWFK